MLMFFVQKGRANSATGETPDSGAGRAVKPPPNRALAAGVGVLIWQFLGAGSTRVVGRLRQLFGRADATSGARVHSGN
jgi:hypothetical protein